GSAVILRIPSTFTFVTEYYYYTVAAAAIAYAAWRHTLEPRHRGRLGISLIGLMLSASMLSGARSALLLTPAMLLGAVVLDFGSRDWIPRLRTAAAVVAFGLVLATVVLGANLVGLISDVAVHGLGQLKLAFVDEIGNGLKVTVFGTGTGTDTNGARHVLATGQLFQAVGGTWQENWWVKCWLELGIAGLLAGIAFMGGIAAHAIRTTRRLTDPSLRAVAAAITAYLLWVVVSNFKAQPIDLDPTNVFFYLFIGLLLKLPALE